MYSLKINGIYYAIEIGAFIIFFVIYAIAKGFPTAEYAKGLMMSMSSAWALIQIILFLSNGIIDVPRDFWRRASLERRIKTICCKLAQNQEILDDDKIIIEQCIKKFQAIEIVCTEENKEYINNIYETIPEELTYFRVITGTINPDMEVGKSVSETRSRIANIHYLLKSTLHEYAVYNDEYQRLIKEGVFIENLVYSLEKKFKYIYEPGKQEPTDKYQKYLEHFKLLWHTKILPVLHLVIMAFCAVYGMIVILGETTLFYPDLHKYLAPLGYILASNKHFIITLIISVPTLAMFITYTYYGLFNFRLSKFYGLFPHQQTDPSCLVYSAMFTAKLAFPICYNYLLLLSLVSDSTNPDAKIRTVFENVMGVIDMVPYIGTNFQEYFPCIIFVFLILNGCEIYSRIMKALLLENYAFVLDVSYEKRDLGIQILNSERKRLGLDKPKTPQKTPDKNIRDKEALNKSRTIEPIVIPEYGKIQQNTVKANNGEKKIHTNTIKKVVSKKMNNNGETKKNHEPLLEN